MFSSSAMDDDDDDFVPLSGPSKLASLFGSAAMSTTKNPTLTYTAPKQPGSTNSNGNNQTGSSQPAPTMSAICVAAVTGYMLKGDKYELVQGKLGFALLGNEEARVFQLILYHGKQKPITTAKISEQFSIMSQPNNFCSFYDDRQQNWAVMFDSQELASKFLNEVNTVKGKLAPRPSQVSPPEPPKPCAEVKVPEPETTSAGNMVGDKKAKLLSRMAKMGQPILPLPGATVAQLSSSSDEELKSSPEPVALPVRSRATRKPRVVSPVESLQSGPLIPTSYAPVPNYPYMQFIPQPSVNITPNNTLMEALVSETRTQNSEIRMHLCRLTDKLDLVLQKGVNPVVPSVPAIPADWENSSRLQSAKLDEILNLLKNQEGVSSLEKERDTWLAKFNESQQEIAHLKKQLNSLETNKVERNKMEELQTNIRELHEKLNLYESNYAELQKINHQLHISLETVKEENGGLREKLEAAEKGRSMAESLAATLQKRAEDTAKELITLQNVSSMPPDTPNINEEIKKIMNAVYKNLLKQFQPDINYDYPVIKSVISATVREVTLSMLRQDKEDTTEIRDQTDEEQKNPIKDQDREGSKDSENQKEEIVDDNVRDEGPEVNEDKENVKERSQSFQETLENSLAASMLDSTEGMWKPEPPPPPLFEDMDNEDGWLI